MTLETLPTPRYVLAEGPVWSPETGELAWVDIDDGRVLRAPFDGERLGPIRTHHVGGSVGAAIPLADGRSVVTLEAWIGILSADGVLDKSRALLPTNHRFNDAKVDPQGRLVFGSLRRQGGPDGRQVLLRWETNGSITTLDDAMNLANGLGWSPDGDRLYYVDSHDRRVYRRSYGPGEIGPREELIHLDGMPDGVTVDADGRLWITLLDRHRVVCVDAEGRIHPERTIDLGNRHPASVEFVGPHLDRLVITTGFPWLESNIGVARSDDDGDLLMTRVPGVRGLAPTPWRDAPLPR